MTPGRIRPAAVKWLQPAGGKRLAAGAWLLIVLCLILAEVLWRSAALSRLDAFYQDLWFRLGPTTAVERVALVELDEATLASHPDDPLVFWTPHFARACAVLRQAGATVIGIDFLFSASPEQWLGKIGGRGSPAARAYDQEFRRQLASGKVVLAGIQSEAQALLPAADYLVALPDFDLRGHVGSADLSTDRDGALRRVTASAPGAAQVAGEGLRLLSLPMLLAVRASGQDPHAQAWRFGAHRIAADGPPWRLPWAGAPGSVPKLPMQQLLAKGAADDPAVRALAGKVVLIGPAYSGANDLHLTPYGYGFDARLMSGMEIHAQTVEALLAGYFLDEVSSAWRLGMAAALLLIGGALWMRFPVGRGAAILLALLVASAALAWMLHRQGMALPLANLQLAVLALFLGLYGLRFSFGERERGRVRALFSRYVSSAVVDALLAQPEMPRLGGQASEITVLFSDIRNFTTLSERLRPEEVVEILNRWFEAACTVLREEGGSIDKFVGDAVMAEFGMPLAQPDHARRAVRAALRLAALAAELKAWMSRRFADRDLPEFAIGIGLHSGMAVVGNIGSSQRMEYTAIGDTVNLASRLEGVTKTLGCVVAASRATVERVGDGLETGRSEILKVKGRDEAVEVFEILGLKE